MNQLGRAKGMPTAQEAWIMTLVEMHDENAPLARFPRGSHDACARNNDFAISNPTEVWIDQIERRTWFLAEINNESRER